MTRTQEDTIRYAAPPERPAPVDVRVGFGGDPATVGLLFFAIASVALGMVLVGMPTSARGAVIPILVLGAGLYQLVVTVWAAVLGQSLVAVIFSAFSAFWLTLATLLLGLAHHWFGIGVAGGTGAQEVFFIAWACLFLFLLIPCLRLPVVYPLAIALVFLALALAAGATFTGSTTAFVAAGACAFAFAFLAFYAFVNVSLVAMGGKAIPPLGRPLLRGQAHREARG